MTTRHGASTCSRPSRMKSLFIPLQAVCDQLISHGRQTLPELLRATRMPGATLHAALQALVQHNLVDVCLLQPKAVLRTAPAPQHVYEPNAAGIIQWLRWAC